MNRGSSTGDENLRKVLLGGENPFGNNKITNTKYTVWNFLFKNLILQFGTFMNCYFLVIACLQLINELAPVSPITIWLPLIFVFMISATKEAADDINRAREDEKANSKLYTLIGNGQKYQSKSEELVVANLIYLEENEEVPCDMLILSTSDKDHGHCYVQTANLDGETDLKSKFALAHTNALSQQQLSQMRGVIECSVPNANMYHLDARVLLHRGSLDEQDVEISSDITNIALQTTIIRNTDWVIGVALYTGHDTKFGMNKRTAADKHTRLDKLINWMTIFIFIGMVLIVSMMGVFGNLTNGISFNRWYLMEVDHSSSTGIQKFWDILVIPLRFLLLVSMIIPISLKVTIDVTKYAYAMFIDWDNEMYDEETDTFAVATSTSIAEDLAQLTYVFTDKTGTLTENIMKVKYAFIEGVTYSFGDSEDEHEGEALRPYVAREIETVAIALRTLSLCHSAVPSGPVESVVWRASSPDEEALIQAAANSGSIFFQRDQDTMTIQLDGKLEAYQLLHVLEFSSERKRMGILLRCPRGVVHLFEKGADEAIFRRAANYDDGHKPFRSIEKHQSKVDQFSKLGLRTLVLAHREFAEEEYVEIERRLKEAKHLIRNRQEALDLLYESIEKDLKIIGVVAIEDKLQDEVPDTIRALRDAGIKVWMLTGDKLSTAKQIALSCNLISSDTDTTILYINSSEHSIRECLAGHLNALIEKEMHYERAYGVDIYDRRGSRLSDSVEEICIIIEGKDLQVALDECAELFYQVATKAKTVICCRVTPQQKSLVVKLVKNNDNTTLAIGDGGNDVAMIQEASIGVGIRGREGLQATRASDYSFARFKMLKRLVLVHGQLAYHRTSFVGHYCFHKSVFIAFIQIFFGFYSGISGASFFNSIALATYNVFFTGLPVMFYCLDKHIDDKWLTLYPTLYKEPQRGAFFNVWTVLYWGLRSIYQSVVVFFLPLFFLENNVAGNGLTYDQTTLSMLVFSIAILIQTLTIIMESNSITWVNWFIILNCFLSFWVGFFILNFTTISGLNRVFVFLLSDPKFWFISVITTVIALCPFFVMKFVVAQYFPWDYQKIQRYAPTKHEGEEAPLIKDDDEAFIKLADIRSK